MRPPSAITEAREEKLADGNLGGATDGNFGGKCHDRRQSTEGKSGGATDGNLGGECDRRFLIR